MSRFRIGNLGPVWVYVLSFGALFARFGYNFGGGDQDELVPFLMSLLDPSLFQTDWFVQTQAAEIGVRTYVVWLLYPFARIASLPTVAFCWYAASWLLVGSGAYRVAVRIIKSRPAAALAVFLSLGVFHKWTLGSNDLVYSMFVGEMLAWGFALYGLDRWLMRRNVSAAVLLGVAAWFQLLVGLLLAGVLVGERIWDRMASRSFRSHLRSDATALGAFVLAALPAVIPIALQQFDALSTERSVVFYILAPFRNPFHHMFFSFGTKAIVRFGVMLMLAAAALSFLHRRNLVSERVRLIRFAGISLLAIVVTLVFTEFWPMLLVAKFQAYKLTVVLKFLMLVVICGALVSLTPGWVRRFGNTVLRRGRIRLTLSVVTVLAAIGCAVSPPGFVHSRITHAVHAASDLGQMEAWIGQHTEPDALFAVPPSNSTFRSNARRAIVVNYAAFPFDDVDMIIWYDRLMDIAPIEPPASGLGLKTVLDKAYLDHGASDWISLGRRYGIDYVLVDRDAGSQTYPFEVVKDLGRWRVYRLPTS